MTNSPTPRVDSPPIRALVADTLLWGVECILAVTGTGGPMVSDMPLVAVETEEGLRKVWWTSEKVPPTCSGGVGRVVVLTASMQPHEEEEKLLLNEPLGELVVSRKQH
eukprot:9504167-Pyramimonas_sp.AAC.3